MDFASRITNGKCNNRDQILNIHVSNLILTPLTYATLIGEILKCLVYEKSQIPYPFNYLENIITRKRKTNVESQNKHINTLVSKQLNLASRAFDGIKDIISCMKTLFTYNHNNNAIQEVIVLFGANYVTPKEIYKFTIPSFISGHVERNHCVTTSNCQHSVLREIFMSNEWISRMEVPLNPTNFNFLLKLSAQKTVILDNRTLQFFSSSITHTAWNNASILTVNFLHNVNIIHNCCSALSVYEDKILSENSDNMQVTAYEFDTKNSIKEMCSDEHINADVNDIKKEIMTIELETEYLHFKTIWSGFKEKFINKVPALEL